MIPAHSPDQPLPASPLLLEASAGTGKTHAIAELAVRYLADSDGPRVAELLLLTFSTRATGELRQRVYTMLREALATSDGEARPRLQRALDEFDRASILTIHSFCQRALGSLGILGDWDGSEQILASPEAVIRQCAQDVYLTRYLDAAKPPLTPWQATTIALEACTSTLPLRPEDSERAEFAQAVRTLYAQRKQAGGDLSFDDPNRRLRELIASPVGGQVAAALRERYRVVLIDEFQDTDPEQYALLEAVFLTPERPTIMIGDPKQSIYGFRNADLLSYERAAGHAEKRTLNVNYRSDRSVVRAVRELFGDVALGSETIRVTPVEAHHADRLRIDAAPTPGLWLRHGQAEPDHASTPRIDADLTAHIQHLLATGEIHDDQGVRSVGPHDIVILTRTGNRGRDIVTHLESDGIPAIWTGEESVLGSEAAEHWAQVIDAMATRDRTSVMLAAMTPLLGCSLEDLLSDDGGAFAGASRTIHEAVRELRHGSAGTWARLVLTRGAPGRRLAAGSRGQRLTMGLEQVADALSDIRTTDPVELREAFAQLRAGGEHERIPARAATERPAVRVMTLHSAKGLQFPIVLLPEVSDAQTRPWNPFPYVDETETRFLWVGGKPYGPDRGVLDRYEQQAREEELRLLYVGITRAAHLAIVWHMMDKPAQRGALTALLARDPGSPELKPFYRALPDPAGRFDPTLIDVAAIGSLPPRPVHPAPGDAIVPVAATFTRRIDHTWRRTSYSGLTAGLHEVARGMDESDEVDLASPSLDENLTTISPMASLPAGAAFGTAVHAAFEQIDWGPEALSAEAERLADELAPSMGLDPEQTQAMNHALRQICLTPLGTLADGLSLSELPLTARLAELDFDLPMADHGPHATLTDLAHVMAQHLDPGDPLAEYPERLLTSGIDDAALNGILTGSIDAVLQLPTGDFIVVDYKTNRFPVPGDDPLTVGHYQAGAMAEAMMQSHYPLQALLYGAALHRFLTWRLPGYEPERHLRGAGYLFVRGMAGPSTPVVGGMPCGVFTWRPPARLFVAASEVLGGRR